MRTRRAEGSGNQRAGGDHAAQRLLIATERDGNGLSCGNGTLGQISGEANRLAIMARAERGSQLRGFGGDGPQFERSLTSQKN